MSNINLIRERLAKLQSNSKGNSSEKIDYASLFWKPKLGKQVIRIVPRKANKDFPFSEVSMHEWKIFKKNVYCLENFGEKDPVVQLVKELYNEGDDDSKDLAKKIRPRTKYYAQVVVRGEESQGVRIWEFNKTTYEKLLSIMADEDFGDITDITEGTDLTIEGYKDSIQIGKRTVEYVAVNVTPKRNMSPLSTDLNQAKSFLENQKDIMEIYKKYSYDEIKGMLKAYLSPSEEVTSEDVEEEEEAPAPKADKKKVVEAEANDDEYLEESIPGSSDVMEEVKEKAGKKSAKAEITSKVKVNKSTSDKFNDLFEDD